VETNALFRCNEIAPIFAGALPKGVDALVTRQVIGQENTVKAAMTCDYSLGLATFLNDPQMAFVSPKDGEKMFREMLQNTKEYLPKGWEGALR
jgi:alpha-galactosidase